MEKIKVDNSLRVFPMAMVVVGAVVEGRINYLAVAWVCWVNANPPMIGIALGKGHHTIEILQPRSRLIRTELDYFKSPASKERGPCWTLAWDHSGQRR